MANREKSTRIHQVRFIPTNPSAYHYLTSSPGAPDDSSSIMDRLWDAFALAEIMRQFLELADAEDSPVNLHVLSRLARIQERMLDTISGDLEMQLSHIRAPKHLFRVVKR